MSQAMPSLVLDRASPVPLHFQVAQQQPRTEVLSIVPVSLPGLDAHSLRSRGLYEQLRTAGVALKIATQTIGGRAARPAEARFAAREGRRALADQSRTTCDDTGRAVELGSHLYRASRYTFELTLTTG